MVVIRTAIPMIYYQIDCHSEKEKEMKRVPSLFVHRTTFVCDAIVYVCVRHTLNCGHFGSPLQKHSLINFFLLAKSIQRFAFIIFHLSASVPLYVHMCVCVMVDLHICVPAHTVNWCAKKPTAYY